MKFKGCFGSQGLAVLILSTVGLTGCGSGSSNSNSGYQPDSQIPTSSPEDALSNALRTSVFCTGAECNPSVGMLIMTDGKNLGACTASLIGDGLAVTNTHCIPDDLKTEGSDCSNRIFIFFPDSGGRPSERADCAQVIHTTDISSKKLMPDVAFLRLKAAPSRPVLGFSGDGFEAAKIYHLAKVNPIQQGNSFAGELTHTDCRAVYATEYTPATKGPASPVIAFGDCSIEHGNSGSPILDDLGRIHGVIQAMAGGLFGGTRYDDFDRRAMNVGMGTNLGCVDLPGVLPEHPIASTCADGMTEAEQTEAATANKKTATEKVGDDLVVSARDTISKSVDAMFEWKSATVTDRGLILTQERVTLFPKCIRPVKEWISSYKSIFGRVKGSASEEATMPFVSAQFGFNHDDVYTARVDASMIEQVGLKFAFDPKEAEASGSMRVTITRQQRTLLNRAPIFAESVPLCK
jgi:hypothetical protein